MLDLRTQVVRLAHQQPKLRACLLPFLRQTAAMGDEVMGGFREGARAKWVPQGDDHSYHWYLGPRGKGGFFIIKETAPMARHKGWTYVLMQSGTGTGGMAKFIGGGNRIGEVVDMAKDLGAL